MLRRRMSIHHQDRGHHGQKGETERSQAERLTPACHRFGPFLKCTIYTNNAPVKTTAASIVVLARSCKRCGTNHPGFGKVVAETDQRVNARMWAYRCKGRLRRLGCGLDSSLRRQASRPTAQRRGFQPLDGFAKALHKSPEQGTVLLA